FLNEVLLKLIRFEEPDIRLFNFVYQSLISLDKIKKGIKLFHLSFMIRLTGNLGFMPKKNYSEKNCHFNLAEGEFEPKKQKNSLQLSLHDSKFINDLLTFSYSDLEKTEISQQQRDNLLISILGYYKHHIPEFGEVESIKILKTVFA
ncbi:MAG: DNA repair protein RecO C-terminal domain-containing protein, partial [Bacteroidales bacterium]|nr:DNA repair protein RecO C-terminal domain-containing protein [Bacteroidales bacterium]